MQGSDRRRLWLVPAAMVALGGLYFVGLSARYLLNYLAATPSPTRGEYLQGTVLALTMALPLWLLVAAFAYPARKALSRGIFVALNAPAAILAVAFLLMNLIPILLYWVSS